jgi:3-hydroxymyristoyl/3-hydroxydecanoyl-(acyl carrier protein) dehydratase
MTDALGAWSDLPGERVLRFIYIDRILELRRLERIVASLTLDPGETMFRYHFPATPMAPASVLVEAFAQAATALLETGLGFRHKALPVYVHQAKFHRAVRPAVPLRIEMQLSQRNESGAVIGGHAEQAGRRCATCTLGMALAPLGDFFDPGAARGYRTLYQHWLEGATLGGFERPPLEEFPDGDR